MNDIELDLARKDVLRTRNYSELTDEEKKKIDELSCISMINSILAYSNLFKNGASADEIVKNEEQSRWNYLKKYINSLGRDRVVELMQEQMDDIESVERDTFTDSDGLTYNSIKWKNKTNESVKKKLNEVKTSRLYHHIVESNKWATISPYRSEYSDKENRQRMSKLKSDVRNLGYGFIQFVSRWVEDGEAFDEESLMIPNMTKDESVGLGEKYEQSSIIVCDNGKAQEICTTPWETYNKGDTVRTFNLKRESPMNINDAEEIFAKRIGGPVSKTKRGHAKPFTLKEVYEIENARPSYFQTTTNKTLIYNRGE